MHTKIAYRERGSGPLLVLLHGYAGSVLHWDPLLPILEEHYRVVVPNLSHIYMGQEPLTFSNQVEQLAEFLEKKFPKEKFHLAGISYGAALSWGLALRHPDLVARVVFINPMPPGPMDSFDINVLKSIFRLPLNIRGIYMILRTPVGRFFLKRAAEVFRVERKDQMERMDGLHGRKLLFVCHVIYKFSWMLRNENWRGWKERLSQWAHPTLMIYEGRDPLFSRRSYMEFAENLSCDEVIETLGAGHISIQTRSEEIAGYIHKFLAPPASAKKSA